MESQVCGAWSWHEHSKWRKTLMMQSQRNLGGMEEKRKNLSFIESHKFQRLLQGVAFGISQWAPNLEDIDDMGFEGVQPPPFWSVS